MILDSQGYITRATSKKCYRNIFFVKSDETNTYGIVNLGQRLLLPRHLQGQRVRFKIEVIQ